MTRSIAGKFASLLILTLAVILPVLFFEVVLRLLSYPVPPRPEELNAKSIQYEPALFAQHVLVRSQELDTEFWQGHPVKYSINGHGYRGRPFKTEKDQNVHRIMIFGGSSVFDPANSEEDAWPRQLERALNLRGQGKFEVINAGIPGHNSLDATGRLLAEAHNFRPDTTIIYTAWNDIKTLKFKDSYLRESKPYQPGANLHTSNFGALDRILTNLISYRLLRFAVLNQLQPATRENTSPGATRDHALREENFEQLRLAFAAFAAISRSAGADPVLVKEARLLADANGAEEKRKINLEFLKLSHADALGAYLRLEKVLDDLSLQEGLKILETQGLNGKLENFGDHVHLSKIGATRLAELVARELVISSRSSSTP